MSSYSWCNYCYNYGHHIRKCQVLRSDAERGVWRANRKLEQWAEAAERRKAKIAAGDFKCSYCGGLGHRRSGCSLLPDDKKVFTKILNEYRRDRSKVIESLGLGKGAMILAKRKGWRSDVLEGTHLVSLGWKEDSIHPLRKSAILEVYLPKINAKREISLPNPIRLPDDFLDEVLDSASMGWAKLSLICKKPKQSSFPSCFISSDEKAPLVKRLFSTKPKDELVVPYHYNVKKLTHSVVNDFNTSFLKGKFS